jgi:hypothetical protein
MKGKNILIRWLFGRLTDYLINGAERYAKKLKKGEPTRNYDKISKNYLLPEF